MSYLVVVFMFYSSSFSFYFEVIQDSLCCLLHTTCQQVLSSGFDSLHVLKALEFLLPQEFALPMHFSHKLIKVVIESDSKEHRE